MCDVASWTHRHGREYEESDLENTFREISDNSSISNIYQILDKALSKALNHTDSSHYYKIRGDSDRGSRSAGPVV